MRRKSKFYCKINISSFFYIHSKLFQIVGENSGCTAMDQLYHTKCFTCHHCAINLQGKPFYALDGNPYCEEDYLVRIFKQAYVCYTVIYCICTVFRTPWKNVVFAKNLFWIEFLEPLENHIILSVSVVSSAVKVWMEFLLQ